MNNELEKLKVPAIGLIVVGFINAVIGFFVLLSGLARLAGVVEDTYSPVNDAERLGFYFSTFIGYGIAFLSLISAPFIIYGGFQMMKGKRKKLVKFAAILAMLPVTACCFIVGLPFGIWSLIVLSKPEIKAIFNNESMPINYNPPQPPQF